MPIIVTTEQRSLPAGAVTVTVPVVVVTLAGLAPVLAVGAAVQAVAMNVTATVRAPVVSTGSPLWTEASTDLLTEAGELLYA